MAEKPGGETYLFVLEDGRTGKVVGTSGIVSKVGGFEPFWLYRLETSVHESSILGVRNEIQVLQLVQEHDGPSEIGTLYLDPGHRGGAGRLLSLGRFLFMADHTRYFDKEVLAEMRGRIDARNRSPFWEAIGRHFFGVEFLMADRMVMKDKSFIAELMPRHPIYVPILPKAAQAAIGKVHPETEPALRMLQGEGFRITDWIDIFEGGPVVSCAVKDIRMIRESRLVRVHQVVRKPLDAEPNMVSNTQAKGFRACLAPLHFVPGKGVLLPQSAARVLKVREGDSVRVAAPRPGGKAREGM
jgi:arginine N-succinyltransferase